MAGGKFPTTPVLDDFTRADGAIGANWSSDPFNINAVDLLVASNTMKAGLVTNNSEMWWNAATYTEDQEAYITLTTLPPTTTFIYFFLRVQQPDTAASTVDCYEVELQVDVGAHQINIYRVLNGTATTLANVPLTDNFVAGDVFGAAVIGNTVIAYRNGIQIAQFLDTTPRTGAGFLGFGRFNSVAEQTSRYDNFGGGSSTLSAAYGKASTTPVTTTNTSTTTTLNVTYPTGIEAGDLLVLGVGVKPDTATVAAPTGYTAVPNGELAGGGGTTGVDAGPTRMATFYKVAVGTETGTLAITLANTPNVSWGEILVLKTAQRFWNVVGSNAADSTTGTPFTATMGTNPGFNAGDQALIFACTPTDVAAGAQFTVPTLTATGMTATVVELAEPSTTSGNDLAGLVCRADVTVGPSTAAPTFSATAGGTTTNVRGPIVVIRARGYDSSILPAHRTSRNNLLRR